MHKILLVEDDPVLSNNIKTALTGENFDVHTAYESYIAEKLLKSTTYDCVVLDISLPGKNGFELCKWFRTFNTHTPVLFLSALSEIDDKITGYQIGGDDYMTKPFYMVELIFKIKSLINRTQQSLNDQENHIIIIKDLFIDTKLKTVTFKGKKLELTQREYAILYLLAKNKGNYVSKNEILKHIWGKSVDVNTNTIEVYINMLRNKIDKSFGIELIKTKVGFGYYIDIS